MSSIAIGVISPSQSSKTSMEVPDDTPIGDLVESMVEAMELPVTSSSGRQLHYQLSVRGEDGRLNRLAENRTLEQSGVQQDAVLELSVEMVAFEKKRKKSIGDTIFGLIKPFSKTSARDALQEANNVPISLDVYHSNQRQVSVQDFKLDTSIPVWLLISQLTRQLDLPTHDTSGNSLAYYLERDDYSISIDQRQLDYFDTLESQGIQDNANLKLSGIPIQVARLKQVLNTKALGGKQLSDRPNLLSDRQLSDHPKDIRYWFNRRDLLEMKDELHEQKSDPKTLEKIDKTIELIYGILSKNQIKPEGLPYLEHYSGGAEIASASAKNQAISIDVYSPEKVQVNLPFNVYLEISVSLDDLGWMWLSRKDLMNFDIALYVPEIDGLSSFQIIGTNSRRLSLPMEPGEHRITTTYQLKPRKFGQCPVHFDIFQEGRYLNTLVVETQVQIAPVSRNNNDEQTNPKIKIPRQFPRQGMLP